jgi:segregation and condensation protein A
VGGVSSTYQPAFDFAAADLAAEDGMALIVDLDGYEGPLHVLLALARNQKVDLLQLSVTKLADQYLAFVQQARRAQFSLAADYLVMAAWLAYLKSRLLLPKPETKGAEPPAEEMAATLAFRLAKLDAMRRAVEALNARPQLGRDVFARGDPDEVKIMSHTPFEGDLYGLIQAYIGQRQRDLGRRYQPMRTEAYPLDDARRRLRGKLPELGAWTALRAIAPAGGGADSAGANRASCLASTLAAGLELVKEGALEARQLEAFSDLYLRARPMHLEAE